MSTMRFTLDAGELVVESSWIKGTVPENPEFGVQGPTTYRLNGVPVERDRAKQLVAEKLGQDRADWVFGP